MDTNKNLTHKLINIFASVIFLVQSFSPFAAIIPAYAQEVTPTDVQSQDVTPTDAPVDPTVTEAPAETVTPAPTVEETPSITPEETITPQPTIEDTTTPTPTTDTANPTPEVSNNSSQGPPESNVDGASATFNPTAIPTVAVENQTTEDNGTVAATILKNISAPSLDLSETTSAGAASLSTDKADYAPTDTAFITGKDFTPNKTYSVTVSSSDQPATSTTVQVTTDDNGVFVYAYQLDGHYRANYLVVVKDADQTVATTTFTDSIPSGCTNDSAGANDVPNQKDLTKMCADYTGLPTQVGVSWNWDDIGWSGNNSGDACALFDNDSNGNADYAVCVQVKNTPATYQAKFLYSCDDSSATNCLGNVLLSPSAGTTCTASVVAASNPFDSGSDTVGSCTVALFDVGGSVAQLTDVCSYPSASTPSNASDCIQYRPSAGKLTVTKVLSPSNDSGLFNLQIDGVTQSGGANVGNGGTTLTTEVSAASHTVGETQGTNTLLSNYTSSVVCKLLHGTGNVVTTTGTGPWTLTVADQSDILCTITNTRVNNGSITIIKDAQPNDAQDFAFTASGSGLTNFTLDNDGDNNNGTSDTKVFSNLAAGTYVVAETAVNGWTQSSATCSDQSPVSAISLQAGENVTCTFINTRDTGTIELKKVWSGTAGQTTLNIGTTANGTDVANVQTGTNGAAPLTTTAKTVNTGTYYVSETGGLTNYTSVLACTDNGNNVVPGANNSLTVVKNHTLVCTYTNTRKQGKIELKKEFVGTPENVTIKIGTTQDGSEVDSDVLSASGTDNEHNVNTGNYFVSETLTTPANYTSAVACYNDVDHDNTVSGGDTTHTVNTSTGLVAVGENDDVICVFTNTRDTGSVKVNKLADKDGNGTYEDVNSDLFTWSLDGSGTNAMGSTASSVNTGTHSVNESAAAGYHFVGWYPGGTNSTQYSCTNLPEAVATHSLPASVSVTTGQTTEITICNAHNTGTVQVKKIVSPSDNSQWDFTISGPTGNTATLTDGQSSSTFTSNTGSYTVGEVAHTGTTGSNYTSSYSCSDDTGVLASGNATTSSFSLTTGKNVLCTFTNSIKKGNVTVIKYHDKNENGVQDEGEETLNDWEIHLDQASQFTGTQDKGQVTFSDVLPGQYTLSETIKQDWFQSNIACGNEEGIDNDNSHTVNVNPGENVTCKIGNYQKGSISGTKFQGDGQTGIKDWTINLLACASGFVNCNVIDDTQTDQDGNYSFTFLTAGYYQVAEVLQSGWTALTSLFHNVSVESGTNSTKNDFTNFKNINIEVCKIEDKNGILEEFDQDQVAVPNWEVHLVTDKDTENETMDSKLTGENGCYTWTNLGPNHTYYVEEVVPEGWTALGDTSKDFGQPTDGQNESFTFFNTQKAHIIVKKEVSGTDVSDKDKFTFNVNGNDFSDSADLGNGDQHDFEVLPGTFTVSEIPNENYSFAGCEATYENESVGIPQTNGEEVTLDSGDTVIVVCTNNQRPGQVGGVKFNDLNGNGNQDCDFEGEFQECEPGLAGVTIYVDLNDNGQLDEGEPSDVTDENGNYTLVVNPGEHSVCEVLQPGWSQTFPNVDGDKCWSVGIGSNGSNRSIDFGNHQEVGTLTIAKSNNVEGSDLHSGDTIKYTITVTANDASVLNTQVTDLLPQGIVYQGGTWGATLNGNPISLEEPTYHSPGVWTIGTLNPGDVVVLTLTAKVSDGQESGLYKDLAWGKGDSAGTTVLALAQPEGFVDTNFVGTQVNVVAQNGTDFKVVHDETQSVLGAATQLPATGSNFTWQEIAFALIIIGLSLVSTGYIIRRRYA